MNLKTKFFFYYRTLQNCDRIDFNRKLVEISDIQDFYNRFSEITGNEIFETSMRGDRNDLIQFICDLANADPDKINYLDQYDDWTFHIHKVKTLPRIIEILTDEQIIEWDEQNDKYRPKT